MLGQPLEGLLVVAALLVGELLAHPFELARRTAFAREALAAGRVPDAAVDAAAAVHPLTLHFSNSALERAYAARAFGESYPIVVAIGLGGAILGMVFAVAVPAGRVVAFGPVSIPMRPSTVMNPSLSITAASPV